MATVGAAICMSHGTDCNWTKVIYAAAIASARCNLKGGADERVARKTTTYAYVYNLELRFSR